MAEGPKDQVEVSVIGAGVIGICCALSLLEDGFTVRLIDRDDPGQGASYGNAGVISPWSFVPQSVPGLWKNIPGWLLDPDGPLSIRPGYMLKALPWALRFLSNGRPERVREVANAMETLTAPCVELYRRHLSGTGHEGLVVDSCYLHAFRNPDRANLDAMDYVMRRERGASIEKVGAEELHTLEPCLSQDYKAAILIKDQARALSPGRIGAVLAEKAGRLGAEVVKADVTGLTPNGPDEWRIETSGKAYTSNQVVVAAGAWSTRLLEPLGIRFPLEAERGYHVEFAAPGVSLTNSIMDVEKKFVASSMEGGIRAAGTSEFAGLDAPPNERRIKSLTGLAKRMLPDLNMDSMTSWLGRRPSLPDGLPALGEVPGRKGLHVAFGHSHYGLMMAPKTGRVVADILSNRPTNEDLAPFQPGRFVAT